MFIRECAPCRARIAGQWATSENLAEFLAVFRQVDGPRTTVPRIGTPARSRSAASEAGRPPSWTIMPLTAAHSAR